MELKKLSPAPVFDPAQPYGEIYGGARTRMKGAAICQGGHYFLGNHDYVGSDPGAKKTGRGKKVELAPRETGSLQVTEEELPELLKHDRAEELMELPLEKLSQLVAAAGGPSYSGDRALALYAGWLIKHTNVDG